MSRPNKVEVYCSECGKKFSRVPSQLEKCGVPTEEFEKEEGMIE